MKHQLFSHSSSIFANTDSFVFLVRTLKKSVVSLSFSIKKAFKKVPLKKMVYAIFDMKIEKYIWALNY